jgi:multidrug efflux pump subunit AcrB
MLLLTGTTVNIQSFIGTIFLVGIEVSNQVLLVDFANRLRAQGMTIYEAVVKASSIRLRPILMTAAATLAAMLPMAIRIGTGAEANVPLARAVIGGLLFSLLLTRFVVPSLYLTLKGSKEDGETQSA